jgi:nitrogen fixation protein NifU and related proteins
MSISYTLARVIGENGITLYSPELLDHFSNPRNVGEVVDASLRVAVENPVCGDQMRVSVRVEEGKIVEARFLARGCTSSIACGSALTGLLVGKDLVALKSLMASQVEAVVGGLNAESKHAAVLCADVVRQLEAAWKKS